MSNLLVECNNLYIKTKELFLKNDYSGTKEAELIIIDFAKEHFLEMNRIATACIQLDILGYSSEAVILSRTLFEKLIDYNEIFKTPSENENMVSRIKKYNLHKELFPIKKMRNINMASTLLNLDNQTIKDKQKTYKNNFDKNDKWYCKSINKIIVDDDDDTLRLLYIYLCFYSHGNFNNTKSINALFIYHCIYTQYITVFNSSLNRNYFEENHKSLLAKIKKELGY